MGGAHDMDQSAPATNDGLYAMLGAPEQGLGVGIGLVGEPTAEILLVTALSNTVAPFLTFPEWYDAAMEYGETHTYTLEQAWDKSPTDYYCWPDENWIPSEHEATYIRIPPVSAHWGWKETYLQLRPESWSSLDEAHNHYVATPEPCSSALAILALGFGGFYAARRRRKTRPD